jgi:hypothetical protein
VGEAWRCGLFGRQWGRDETFFLEVNETRAWGLVEIQIEVQ